MIAPKGIWDSLTDEQKEKAKDRKTMDELMKLAGKQGIELPDEALDMVSGGCGGGSDGGSAGGSDASGVISEFHPYKREMPGDETITVPAL